MPRYLILDFITWNHDANNQYDIPMEAHTSPVSGLPEPYFNISVTLHHLYCQLVHSALDIKGSTKNRDKNSSETQNTCGFRCH